MTPYTIPNNMYLNVAKDALKLAKEPPDLLYTFLTLRLACGSDLKSFKKPMTPYAIPNNLFLAKDALKLAEGPPDLLCGHLFKPGAGCGVRYEKS